MKAQDNTTGLMRAFDFEEQAVRTLVRDEEPWFVARDVCGVLGIKNSRDALSRLDEDEKGVALTDTLGGRQSANIISESGLYTIILRCDDAIKPGTTAHRFRKWVTAEVLPAIRTTGRYELAPTGPLQDVRELLLTSARDVRDKKLDVGRAQQIANLAARYLEVIKLEGDILGYEKVLGLRRSETGRRVLPVESAGAAVLQAVPQREERGEAAAVAGGEGEELRGEEGLGGGESHGGEAAPGEGDLSEGGASGLP